MERPNNARGNGYKIYFGYCLYKHHKHEHAGAIFTPMPILAGTYEQARASLLQKAAEFQVWNPRSARMHFHLEDRAIDPQLHISEQSAAASPSEDNVVLMTTYDGDKWQCQPTREGDQEAFEAERERAFTAWLDDHPDVVARAKEIAAHSDDKVVWAFIEEEIEKARTAVEFISGPGLENAAANDTKRLAS